MTYWIVRVLSVKT